MIRTRTISIITASVALLTFIALLATRWFPPPTAFRIVFGSIPILFLPGFFVTWIFFPRADPLTETDSDMNENSTSSSRSLDWIERGTLSILLSIAITSAVVYTLYMIPPRGVHTTPQEVTLGILAVNFVSIAAALVVYHIKMSKAKR